MFLFSKKAFMYSVMVAASIFAALIQTNTAMAQTSSLYKGGYQQQSSVAMAQVVSVREVLLNTQERGNGQIIGQLVGGAIGVLLGQNSNNYALAGIAGTLGSVVGGQVGNSFGNSQIAQELIIRFDDGRLVAITQSSTDGIRFGVGQRVMIIGQGRVAPSL